jgi:hypothetical protein
MQDVLHAIACFFFINAHADGPLAQQTFRKMAKGVLFRVVELPFSAAAPQIANHAGHFIQRTIRLHGIYAPLSGQMIVMHLLGRPTKDLNDFPKFIT